MTLAFLALLGAPYIYIYIYDISSLRVKCVQNDRQINLIDMGHSCELAERHQILEVCIMILSFQTALLLRMFSLKRQFYTNSDKSFLHHEVTFFCIPRKSHFETCDIQNGLMALLLGVSETDVQQCFQVWQTDNPCVQMEGK